MLCVMQMAAAADRHVKTALVVAKEELKELEELRKGRATARGEFTLH
jgi:hypothetical protein